jgi:AAA family ATP:ADP antiporter
MTVVCVQVRNYMFTMFYCSAELWGDVVLSLLFWGLANETTSMAEAPLLYPLFGIGANLGQALSGRLLSIFSSSTARRMSYATQMQVCVRR